MSARRGFTLLELLVAVALLGALTAALLPALERALVIERGNRLRLERTAAARAVVERVLGEWRDPGRFEQACLAPEPPLPPGVRVEVQPLTADGRPAGPAHPPAPCPRAPQPGALRRVTVRAGAGAEGPVELVVDVSQP